jgi:beta-galactosidase
MTARSRLLPALLIALSAGSLLSARARRPAVAPDTILYGVAYYHEYMPYERLDQDIALMKRAGISVVRVGEEDRND